MGGFAVSGKVGGGSGWVDGSGVDGWVGGWVWGRWVGG